jgi:hypothetical protein
MKKIFTLALALTAFAVSSFGQCVADSAALNQNQLLYPNSMPGILQGSSYSSVLSLLVPDSVPGRDFNNPFLFGQNVAVDSIRIDAISGYPSGISSSSSPSLGSWIPVRGYACAAFSGTTTAPIGNYPLTITGVGCGHVTLPFIGRVDSCMPINFSSIYPYSIQVCDTQCTNTYDTTYVSLCRGDSIQWGNVTVRRAGRYVDTVLMSIGCDSLRLLYVVSINPATGRDTLTSCAPISYQGGTYANDTTINEVLTGAAANGCDSTVRHRLRVGGRIPTITASSTALTAVDPRAASYQWLENNATISGATAVNYSPTGGTLNSYAVVVTDIYGCVDTSAAYLADGISDLSTQTIKLYPSPNNGSFILETHNARGTAYTVTNSLGQVVERNTINMDKQAINLGNVATGVYTISMKGIDPITFTVTK